MNTSVQLRRPNKHCWLALSVVLLLVGTPSQPTLADGVRGEHAYGAHELLTAVMPQRSTPLRLAVFPFSVLPVTEETAYLSHALSDAISDQLAMTPGLQLIARQSVQAAHDAGLTRVASARVLDASFILDGDIRPGTDSIVIELRLWSSSLQRNEWVMQVSTGGPVLQQLPWQVAQRVRASVAGAH